MFRLRNLFYLGFLLVWFIATCDALTRVHARNLLYTDVEAIPYKKVGLLLGTSKYTARGNANWYYTYRVQAAIQLFTAGKIDYILVSGDNGHVSYDEPTTFKKDLMAGGVPADRIVLDYAGFSTFDSVVRCKKVFQEKNITIISQPFHNERALFIARCKGLQAQAFNAKSVDYDKTRMGLREKAARVKMMLDLGFGAKPKFLGDPIPIGV